jgi:hypothetical protein
VNTDTIELIHLEPYTINTDGPPINSHHCYLAPRLSRLFDWAEIVGCNDLGSAESRLSCPDKWSCLFATCASDLGQAASTGKLSHVGTTRTHHVRREVQRCCDCLDVVSYVLTTALTIHIYACVYTYCTVWYTAHEPIDIMCKHSQPPRSATVLLGRENDQTFESRNH